MNGWKTADSVLTVWSVAFAQLRRYTPIIVLQSDIQAIAITSRRERPALTTIALDRLGVSIRAI